MESSTRNHYALLAADLRHEISALAEEIEKLETKRANLQNTLDFVEARMASMDVSDENGESRESTGGPYSGLSLVNAAVKYLQTVGRPMQTRAIADAVVKGGYKTTSRNVYNNVYGTLNRESEKKSPRVVKRGTKWSLPPDREVLGTNDLTVSEELTPEAGLS